MWSQPDLKIERSSQNPMSEFGLLRPIAALQKGGRYRIDS
jgi:hypothetical protein